MCFLTGASSKDSFQGAFKVLSELVIVSLQTITVGSSQEPSNNNLAVDDIITCLQALAGWRNCSAAPATPSSLHLLSLSVSTCSRLVSSFLPLSPFSLYVLPCSYPQFFASTLFPGLLPLKCLLYTRPVICLIPHGDTLIRAANVAALRCIIPRYVTNALTRQTLSQALKLQLSTWEGGLVMLPPTLTHGRRGLKSLPLPGRSLF